MMLFSRIYFLGLLVPLLILWVVLLRKQYGARAWILKNVSPRFQEMFTRYGAWSLPAHMCFLLLMGSLIVIAAAGPYTSGMIEKQVEYGNVILVIDASFSMVAGDTKKLSKKKKKPANRLAQAKQIAMELIDAFPEHRFALISFSGIAAIHSPPTSDNVALKNVISSLTLHAFQSMGTSFKGALERIIHMVRHKSDNYQAVILSDGEIPHPDDYAEEIGVLQRLKVPVHAVGIGTTGGNVIQIYNPDDVRGRVSKPRIAKKVTTRREDKHMEEIARRTGGKFLILDEGAHVADLMHHLKKGAREKALVQAPGKNDLGWAFLAAFLVCFLVETLLLAWYWRPAAARAGRFGSVLVALAGLMLSGASSTGCNNRLWTAHLLNEKGILQYTLRNRPKAQAEFEKSSSYATRAEIPTYNLANNYMKDGNYSAAHKYYEEALAMEPHLREALFNDGHALYLWGQKELDPRSLTDDSRACNAERARALWEQAIKRFERSTLPPDKEDALSKNARTNLEFTKKQLAQLDIIAAKCRSQKDKQDKDKKDQDKKDQDKKDKDKKDKDKKDKDKQDKDKQDQDKQDQDTSLSKEEQDKINESLGRIKKQRRGKFYEQTKHQQIQYKKENGKEKGGQEKDGKEKDGKEKDGKEKGGQEKDGKEKGGKEKGGQEKDGQEKGGQKKKGSEKGGKNGDGGPPIWW